MKINFYTHSCYSIECGGKHLLVDPFFTKNPIFLKEPTVAQDYLKNLKADYILVTHAHFDHTADVVSIAKCTRATVISNYEITDYFKRKKNLNIFAMNFGAFSSFDFGNLKYVWAAHSSMFPDGAYGGNPGGFLLSSEGKNIYIAGDTSLTQEMKLLPLFAKLDLIILPIGGLFTMNVDEAIIASDFIECNKILGVHYNTFQSIKIDTQVALKKFSSARKELILLKREEEIKI